MAQEAKVDTALLHYYFKTKRGLFDAVFERRAEIINKERIESIDAYVKSAGSAITVEGVIDAFLQPILRRAATGDQRWHNYFALIAQVNNTPAWGGETMGRTFDNVIHHLIDALRKALPGRERGRVVLELSLPVRRADADAVADRAYRPAVRGRV